MPLNPFKFVLWSCPFGHIEVLTKCLIWNDDNLPKALTSGTIQYIQSQYLLSLELGEFLQKCIDLVSCVIRIFIRTRRTFSLSLPWWMWTSNRPLVLVSISSFHWNIRSIIEQDSDKWVTNLLKEGSRDNYQRCSAFVILGWHVTCHSGDHLHSFSFWSRWDSKWRYQNATYPVPCRLWNIALSLNWILMIHILSVKRTHARIPPLSGPLSFSSIQATPITWWLSNRTSMPGNKSRWLRISIRQWHTVWNLTMYIPRQAEFIHSLFDC